MNWFEMINQAASYIEMHISENINLEDIAKECNVSYYYFSKTFTMITGYTLKEYIRNRRVTLASYEVSNTDHRILDIAIKYGYSSNEAFSRAFKKIHGINPSNARKNNVTTYTHFPVLQYKIPKQNILSLRYEIIKNIEYSFVGKSIHMQEKYEEYDKAQKQQKEFLDNFKSSYPSEQMVYRVLYDLSSDFLSYNFFVGYENHKYELVDDLETINIIAPKAVRFISTGINKSLIPEIKLVIFNEWQKNGFVADLICEMEFVVEKPKSIVDFSYIVSIK
ncbi:AraC family transcriptional regulator [Mycoplasmatota bacterium WC30]